MPDQSSAATEHALMQEITAPLRTLPDEAAALVHAEFPTSMRGYDRHAVDDYVAQVTGLVEELQAARSPEAAVRRALERVGEQISGILQRAHQTAEQITGQSRAEAEDRMEQARRDAATVIDAAERRVRELDADCDRLWAERQRIIDDAEALSGQLLAVARDASQRLPGSDETRGEPSAVDDTADFGDHPSAPIDEPEDELFYEDEDEDGGGLEVDDGSGEPPDDLEDDLEQLDETGASHETAPAVRDEIPEVERTLRFSPQTPPPGPSPRRITDEDTTRIIPPASDAARQHHDD